MNKVGGIKHSIVLFIWLGNIIHKEEFYTMTCGKDNIILRLPWLNRVNPTIDWQKKHININEATDQTNEYNLALSEKSNFIRVVKEPPIHPNLLPPDLEKELLIFPDKKIYQLH